jgi:hypothetical protein
MISRHDLSSKAKFKAQRSNRIAALTLRVCWWASCYNEVELRTDKKTK